ncbi:acetolactate synthase large subunit [Flagellimonas sp. 2504JD4-2]
MNASEQIVAALANEGVEYVFGIPGDENLHFMEALRKEPDIKFILCRHEQAAGFMAASYGRLTGKLAVAMATLGAGATNLTTAVAHAYLAGMPMLVITGQKAIRDNKMGMYQLVDVVDIMRPITKFTTSVPSGLMLGSLVRQAMMSALSDKMGPAHLEIPEDILRDKELGALVPCRHGDKPIPSNESILKAVNLLENAKSPLIMVGGGTRANRPEVSAALRKLIDQTKIPFIATMMGKGVALEKGPLYVGTTIMPGDYTHCAVKAADVILNVGHDVQEKPTFQMSPGGLKTVIHLNPYAAMGDPIYFPQHQVIGDMAVALNEIAKYLRPNPNWDHSIMLSASIKMDESIHKNDQQTSFPAHPGYVVSTLRNFMGENDIISLDNGIHMMWMARNYGAFEPNTMLIDHALGSMGISLPAAISAKLVYPERKVVVVTGDGGFMMNSQEIETAVRLKLDLIIIIFNDSGLGMIDIKQRADGYGNYGVNFDNPDFVAYANSFGAFGHRLENPVDFKNILEDAHGQGGVHVIDVPVDKKQNMMLLKEMKMTDCSKL